MILSHNVSKRKIFGAFPGLEHHHRILLFVASSYAKTIKFSYQFYKFYSEAEKKMEGLSKKYKIPITVYFGLGHAGKFK